MAETANIYILTLSEIWLNANDVDFSLSIPTCRFQNERVDLYGGGLAVFCHDAINFSVAPLYLHQIFLRIVHASGSKYSYTTSRPPGQTADLRNAFLDVPDNSISLAVKANLSGIYIPSDFNDTCQSWNSDHLKSDI